MPRPKRLGQYAPLSATYYQDDAIIAAGEKAEVLYTRALAFCASSDSDGFISCAQLVRVVGAGMRDAQKRAEILVTNGLLLQVDGGYVVRSWLKWNKSAEDIGRERRKDRDRKAAGRNDPEPPEPEPDSDWNPGGIPAESNGNPNGVQPDSSPRAPAPAPESLHTTPLHSTSGTSFGEESHQGNARTRPPRTCPKHRGDPDPPNCGKCADARREADSWQPPTATPPPMAAHIRSMPPVDPGLAAAARAARQLPAVRSAS